MAVVFLVPKVLWAQGAGQFEQPPIINVTQLLPEGVLSGPGFHVEQLVPTTARWANTPSSPTRQYFRATRGRIGWKASTC